MRTFAMRAFALGYLVAALNFAYQFVAFFLPELDSPEVAPILPVVAVLGTLILATTVAAAFWSGGTRRAWFWLAGILPAALLLLVSLPYIPYALTHPTDAQGFALAVTLIVAVVVVVLSGVRAFLDIRRPGSELERGPRANVVLGGTVVAVVAALLTSLAASGASGAGSVSETDTVAILEAKNTTFVQTSLEIAAGERLGLMVVNHDSYSHSFDIDSLDIHVQLPANSSTLVAIEPTGPGEIEFYCGVPGHPEAGMTGTITVH